MLIDMLKHSFAPVPQSRPSTPRATPKAQDSKDMKDVKQSNTASPASSASTATSGKRKREEEGTSESGKKLKADTSASKSSDENAVADWFWGDSIYSLTCHLLSAVIQNQPLAGKTLHSDGTSHPHRLLCCVGSVAHVR
jgi:hypothetical protein